MKTVKAVLVMGKVAWLLLCYQVGRITCQHEYHWFRDIYGDEINRVSGYRRIHRSEWCCRKCSRYMYRDYLGAYYRD